MRSALFTRVFTIQALKLMTYRVDFWLTAVVSFGVNLLVVYVLWNAVYAETGRAEIGGYTLDEMIAYYILVLLVGKVVRGGERDYTVSTDVYEGPLTRYLLYPSPYFGFKYAEQLGNLAPGLVQFIVFGAAAFLIMPFPDDYRVTPQTVAMGALALFVANLLNFLLVYPIQLVAFWADNVWSLMVMLRFVVAMMGGQLLPLTLFPEWAQQSLRYLPFQYLFYFPVETMTGKISVTEWALGMFVGITWCCALGLLTRAVWKRGLLQYTGVGI